MQFLSSKNNRSNVTTQGSKIWVGRPNISTPKVSLPNYIKKIRSSSKKIIIIDESDRTEDTLLSTDDVSSKLNTIASYRRHNQQLVTAVHPQYDAQRYRSLQSMRERHRRSSSRASLSISPIKEPVLSPTRHRSRSSSSTAKRSSSTRHHHREHNHRDPPQDKSKRGRRSRSSSSHKSEHKQRSSSTPATRSNFIDHTKPTRRVNSHDGVITIRLRSSTKSIDQSVPRRVNSHVGVVPIGASSTSRLSSVASNSICQTTAPRLHSTPIRSTKRTDTTASISRTTCATTKCSFPPITCHHHPYIQLKKYSTRTNKWMTLLDICPLCMALDEKGIADSANGGGCISMSNRSTKQQMNEEFDSSAEEEFDYSCNTLTVSNASGPSSSSSSTRGGTTTHKKENDKTATQQQQKQSGITFPSSPQHTRQSRSVSTSRSVTIDHFHSVINKVPFGF